MEVVIHFTDETMREFENPEPNDAGFVIIESLQLLTPAERAEVTEIEVAR